MPTNLMREKKRSSTQTKASAVKADTMPMIKGDWFSFAIAAITSGGTCIPGKTGMAVEQKSDKSDVMEGVTVLGDP